jgi:hypothetical protein
MFHDPVLSVSRWSGAVVLLMAQAGGDFKRLNIPLSNV